MDRIWQFWIDSAPLAMVESIPKTRLKAHWKATLFILFNVASQIVLLLEAQNHIE
jgi:hypothetical protein